VNLVLASVLAYVAAQLLIGLAVSRRIESEDDYLLAGRSLNTGLATFSFFATWFGAESCLGTAGAIYARGLAGGSSDPFGYALCLMLMGIVFAAPLWRRRITTLADLFRERYSRGVERLVVAIAVPTSILWAAAQVRAFGQVLDASSGVGVELAIGVAAAVAIAYTMMGGLWADVATDLVQGIVIVIGVLAVGALVLAGIGGAGDALRAIDPARLEPLGATGTPLLERIEAWAVPICGSISAQELLARALACRSARVARSSAILGGGLYLALGVVPVMIGLLGPALIPDLADPEQIFPRVAEQHLPTWAYVIFLGALVSAILSTVDSSLLAASALVTHNLVLSLRPGLSERAKVAISRAGVAAAGALAFGLAISADSIFELVEGASAFGGAGVFAIFALGTFTRSGGAPSAYAALVSAMVVWGVGSLAFDWSWPWLGSLLAALAAYALAAGWSRRGGGARRELRAQT
jgi:SSS family transporter